MCLASVSSLGSNQSTLNVSSQNCRQYMLDCSPAFQPMEALWNFATYLVPHLAFKVELFIQICFPFVRVLRRQAPQWCTLRYHCRQEAVNLDATIHFSRLSFCVHQPFKVDFFLLNVTLLSFGFPKRLISSFAPAGIPTTTAKPAGYPVRMEASVPLPTQAPPIQPLQIRPGVITQVK